MTTDPSTTTLILQHQDDDGPGNLQTWLHDRAMPYEIVDVTAGALPESGHYRALAILGSSRSAYDTDEPWIQAEHDFVRACIAAGTPVLGICFGAQLLAMVLGGHVVRMSDPELGWYDITGEHPYSGTWFVWHGDEITAPPGSKVLARTDRCTHAFVHGHHLGVQYHPELTAAHIDFWLATPRRRRSITDFGGDIDKIRSATSQFEPNAVANAAQLYRQFFCCHEPNAHQGESSCPPVSLAQ